MDDFKRANLGSQDEYSWKDEYEGIQPKRKPLARRYARRIMKMETHKIVEELNPENGMGAGQ